MGIIYQMVIHWLAKYCLTWPMPVGGMKTLSLSIAVKPAELNVPTDVSEKVNRPGATDLEQIVASI